MTIFRCVSIVVTRCYHPEKRHKHADDCVHHHYEANASVVIVDSGRWHRVCSE